MSCKVLATFVNTSCVLYPLTPHFYIVKLGFTGVYIIFLFLLKNIYCGYSLEPLNEAVLKCTHNICFEQKYENSKKIQLKILIFFIREKSLYIAWACYRNEGSFIVLPGLEENSMSYFEVSPDGQYLVFMGKHGKMHLISSKVKYI